MLHSGSLNVICYVFLLLLCVKGYIEWAVRERELFVVLSVWDKRKWNHYRLNVKYNRQFVRLLYSKLVTLIHIRICGEQKIYKGKQQNKKAKRKNLKLLRDLSNIDMIPFIPHHKSHSHAIKMDPILFWIYGWLDWSICWWTNHLLNSSYILSLINSQLKLTI